MTTEQYERAHVLINKINQHKSNLEDLEEILYSYKTPRDITMGYDVSKIPTTDGSKDFFIDTIVGKIPAVLVRKVLQTIIEHHQNEIKELEQQLEKL